MDLSQKKCVPCEGGEIPLDEESAKELKKLIDPNWELEAKKINREFVFKNFAEAVGFINKVAEIAESEGHHPDINLYSYKKVKIDLSTHAIGGLSGNDFILAAKIDKLVYRQTRLVIPLLNCVSFLKRGCCLNSGNCFFLEFFEVFCSGITHGAS